MASTAELAILLTARDMASKEIQGLGASLGKLGGLGKVAAVGLAGIATAGAGLLTGLGASINSAANFEAVLSQVAAVSGATGSELAALSDLALKMGADTSFSASEAAQAMAELAKGGIQVKDMAAVLPGTLDLAAAGGLGLAEAATIATDSMAIFATQGVTMDQVANAFAGAANISSISVQDMAEAMKYAGPVAASMGIKMEDVSAAIALLGANGIKASSAGTGIRTMLTGLAAPTAKARNLMEDLGLEFFDSSGKMKDFAGISDTLKSKLKGMSDAQRLATLETLFGKEGMSAAIAIMGEGDNSVKSYTQRLKEAATANATGKKMLDNFSGSMEALKGSVETAAITLGLAFLPALRKIVDGLTGAVNAAVPFVKQYGPVLVAALQQGIGVLMQWGGAVWGAVSAVVGAFAALLAGKTTLAEFIGGMEIFVSTILGQLGGLASAVAPYIGQFFSAIGTAIVTYGPQIGAQMLIWAGYLTDWITGTAIPWLLPKLAAFGTALWGWITGTAVPAVVSAVGGLASAFGGWISGTAIPYLQENLPLWGAALWDWITDTAVPTVVGRVVGLANALGDWIGTVAVPYLLEKLPEWGTALWDWITNTAVPTVVGRVVGLANALGDWVTTQAVPYLAEKFPIWIEAVRSWIADSAVPTVVGAVVGLKNALVDWITSTAVPYLQEKFPQFTSAISTLISDATKTTDGPAHSWGYQTGEKMGEGLIEGGSDGIGKALSHWTVALGLIFPPLIALNMGKGKEIGDALGAGLAQGVTAVAAALSHWYIAFVLVFPPLIALMVLRGDNMGAGFVQGMLTGLGKKKDELLGWFSGLPNEITKAVGDLSKTLYQKGVDVVTGLIDGITSQFGALGTAIGNLTNLIPGGVKQLLESHSPSKVMARIGVDVVDGLVEGMDSAKQDAAKKAAEVASAISKAIIDTLAAMKALATYDFATQSPSGETMGWFTHLTTSLVQNLATAAADFDEKSLKATSAFADTVGKVGSAVGSAVNGLKALATADWAKTSPSGSAMAWLTHLVASLIENFRNAATAFDEEGMKQASAFADTASKVLGIIGNGVTALQALNSFVAPSKQAIDNFLAAALYVVDRFGEVANTLSTEGIAKTTAFADAAGKALAATKTGVDAFLAFKGLVIPSKEAIDNLMIGMQYVIQRMQEMATAIGVDGLKQAQDFADAAGRVFATVKAGLELLNSLKTYKDLPAKAIGELIKAFEGLFENLGQLQTQANAFEQQADTFLGTMQRAAQKIANGLALGGAAPKIGTGLELAPNTGGFDKGGSGGGSGGTVNNITVTGNTLLQDEITVSQSLANILAPALSRQVSYSY